MKKVLIVALLLALAGTAVFAQTPAIKLSAGGGALVNAGLGGGVEEGGQSAKITNVGFGAFGFFDATYAEIAVGFTMGPAKMVWGSTDIKGTYGALSFSLLGKYPFAVGQFTIFPLLGVEYRLGLMLGGDLEDGEAGDLSALWFNGGVGGDFNLSEKLYVRGEVLYGIRLKNKFDKDMEDMSGLTAKLGHGPTVKIGVGYRF